jgi:hypothetical protein
MVQELSEQSADSPADSSDCQSGDRSTKLPLPLGIGYPGDQNHAHSQACADEGAGEHDPHCQGQPSGVQKERLGDHPGQESGPTADYRGIVDETVERQGLVASGLVVSGQCLA